MQVPFVLVVTTYCSESWECATFNCIAGVIPPGALEKQGKLSNFPVAGKHPLVSVIPLAGAFSRHLWL